MTSLIRKSLRRNRSNNNIEVSKPKGSPFIVNLLDGETKTVHVDRKEKGQALLDKVLFEIDLNENEYFGLCWRDKSDLKIWLDPEKPIRKQLTNEENTLDFTVRFYAEDPCQLQEEYTRYFFCLQIKQDLLAGRLPCSFYTGALLASYAVQAEVGDYDVSTCEPDGIPSYIKEMEFVPGQNEEFEAQVAEFHKSHAGQTPSDAEMNMLDKVKRLELYGVDLHAAMDLEGIRLYIGISPTGIRIYQAGDMVRMNSFNWAKVLQVSFHKDKFYIQLRPSEKSVVKDKIGFRIPSIAACKNLWKSCVDHHTFFRLYVAEKRIPAVLGLFRTGSKYRASVRGTQKQALERSKSCHQLDNYKTPSFERTPSQRIGKSRSEGAINLLGSKPYVRNSFYDTYRASPSEERLNRQSDSFMVTTTVSPSKQDPEKDEHLYNNMSNVTPTSPTTLPQFIPDLYGPDHVYANHDKTTKTPAPGPPTSPPPPIPPSLTPTQPSLKSSSKTDEEDEESETTAMEASTKEELSDDDNISRDPLASQSDASSYDDDNQSPYPVYHSPASPAPVFTPPPPKTQSRPAKPPPVPPRVAPAAATDDDDKAAAASPPPSSSSGDEVDAYTSDDDSDIMEIPTVSPPPPPPHVDKTDESPLYTPVYKVAKPVDSNRRRSPSPPPSNNDIIVEYDSIDEVRSKPVTPPPPAVRPKPYIPPKPKLPNGNKYDRDDIRNEFKEKEEEPLAWHDKSQYNIDDEWLELDRLTQDVARMTDDLAMDLDLDGPEKNVYVVNPQKPSNASRKSPQVSRSYGTPPPITTPPPPPVSNRAPRSPRSQQEDSPAIIKDVPSAAEIMKKWQQRERHSKNEIRNNR